MQQRVPLPILGQCRQPIRAQTTIAAAAVNTAAIRM